MACTLTNLRNFFRQIGILSELSNVAFLDLKILANCFDLDWKMICLKTFKPAKIRKS